MKTPKYLKIKKELKDEIQSGKFTSGDKFYSEKELIQKYQVSSITVIRAIQELTTEGFLIRIQGKGTYISRARKRKLVEFSDVELFPLGEERVEVLDIVEEADSEILNKLELKKGQTYFKISRRRLFQDTPYMFQESFIPSDYINKKYQENSYYQSIYYRFKSDFNINMTEQFSIETTDIQFPINQSVSKKLMTNTEQPVVIQEKKTSHLDTGKILEYAISYKKWNFYKIEFSTFHLN